MKTVSSTFVPAPPRKLPTLAADFSWTFVGNCVYAGAQFAVLMILAKLVRPEMVGQYALGLALVYPVMMFTNLQLRAVLSSDSTERVAFGHYFGLRLIMTAFSFVSVFVVARILGYDRQLTAVVMMVGVAYGIETISDVFYARLQLHDRMAEIAKSMMARAVLSVLALCLITYATRSVFWGIAGVALARAAILFSYDISERTQGLSARYGRSIGGVLAPRFNWAIQRKVVWLSLPLGIVVLLGCLNSSIPNFFIKSALGEREVGMFAAIGFVVSVGNMAVVSLGQSAFTRLARSYAAGNHRAFEILLVKLLAFGAMLGIGGMIVSKFFGREFLTVLFHPEYAQRADLLPWIMAAGGVLFMSQFLGFGLTAANFYHSQVVLNCLAVFSLVLGCWWLVPPKGLLGAIFAMLIGATVQLIGSVVVLLRGLTVKIRMPVCSEGAETV